MSYCGSIRLVSLFEIRLSGCIIASAFAQACAARDSGQERQRYRQRPGSYTPACGDTPEVLQSAEGVLDAASFFVEAPFKAEQLLSVARLGMTGLVPRSFNQRRNSALS
jgi:hypothetical protein